MVRRDASGFEFGSAGDRPEACCASPALLAGLGRSAERVPFDSLARAGAGFEEVEPAALAAALPEPSQPHLVHLDAYAGNMLAEGSAITGVVDFGVAISGDRRLDPLLAAAYLPPCITPSATDVDAAVAREWLAANDLYELYEPARRWSAA